MHKIVMAFVVLLSGLAHAGTLNVRAAIRHDMLDFCVRELVTFGKGGGAIIIPFLQPAVRCKYYSHIASAMTVT